MLFKSNTDRIRSCQNRSKASFLILNNLLKKNVQKSLLALSSHSGVFAGSHTPEDCIPAWFENKLLIVGNR